MDTAALPAFFAVSLVVVITPGADWAYILSHATSLREALAAIGGLLVGYLGHTLLAAAGLTLAVAMIPGMLSALTVVGAGYLCWLGVQTLRHPATAHLAAQAAGAELATVTAPIDLRSIRPAPARAIMLRGAGVSGLNPKVVLLFLALMPQFVSAGATWPLSAQIAALGAMHVLATVTFYCVLAVIAVRVLGARPQLFHTVSLVSGVLMLLLGSGLLVEQVVSALG